MELTYESMKHFMEMYFGEYSSHVNSVESIDQLDKVYTVDFTSVVYMHIEGMSYPFVRAGRDEFKKSLVQGHASIRENLYPNNIIIDERKKVVGVLLTSEKIIIKTQVKHVFDGIGFYHLCNREENTIKIERLDIFCDDPDKLHKIYFQTMPALINRGMEADKGNHE